MISTRERGLRPHSRCPGSAGYLAWKYKNDALIDSFKIQKNRHVAHLPEIRQKPKSLIRL